MALSDVPASHRHCFSVRRKDRIRFFSGLLIHLGMMIVTIAMATAYGSDLPELTINLSNRQYSFADTLIIAVGVHLPDGFVLVGNPVGPGIGRPLKIRILSSDKGICWQEVRKMDAEKYGPSFGDWVWVYHRETTLFCTGVVVGMAETLPVQFQGIVELEGLLCRNECRLIVVKAPFSLTITDKSPGTACREVSLPEVLAKTKPMMKLVQSDK